MADFGVLVNDAMMVILNDNENAQTMCEWSVFVCRKPCQASIHDLHLVRQRIYLRYVFDYVLT